MTGEALDSLLARWFEWDSSSQCVRGFARRAAGFSQYRPSRQYDDANGALDSDHEALKSSQVGFEIDQIDQPYRTALYIEARNIALGVSVWSSPRLPADREELEHIVTEARARLSLRLAAAGVS